MCLCVETIRIVDGQPPRPEILTLHQQRANRTCRELYGRPGFDLVAALAASPIPETLCDGVVRCRVVYGPEGAVEVEYRPYAPLRIDSLLMATDEEIDYTYKYVDRSLLDAWHSRAASAGCDDALLVRTGRMTETTRCNVAFRRSDTPTERWHTPAKPLLRGTMREYLIEQGVITPSTITVEELRRGAYDHIALFNALNDFGSLVLPAARIRF